MVKLGALSLVLALLAACGLYALKYDVLRLDRELRRTERAIAAEREMLTRLRAEWATLERPARIGRLAEQHLKLTPAQPYQISSIGAIPLRAALVWSERRVPVTLPSGSEIELRFKPSEPLRLLEAHRDQLEAVRQAGFEP